jgi:hypothetical protein
MGLRARRSGIAVLDGLGGPSYGKRLKCYVFKMILNHRQDDINEDVRQSDYENASFGGYVFRDYLLPQVA